MPVHYEAIPHEAYPAVVHNALQEYVSSLCAFVVRLKPGAANTLQVPAGAGNDQVGVDIDGSWRWVTANVEMAGAGAARDVDVFVTASENDYQAGDPVVDNTDYSFALSIQDLGQSPIGVDLFRRVARARWDGQRFVDVVGYRAGVLMDPTGARTGDLRPWPFSWVPIGWLLCDNSPVTAAANPALREFLLADGSKYGVDGSGNPRLPSTSGRALIGAGTATGATGATAHPLGQVTGEEKHVLSTPELPSHSHPLRGPGAGGPDLIGPPGSLYASAGGPNGNGDTLARATDGGFYSTLTIDPAGGGAGHNIMQPSVAVNWLIKT
jgi:microcystin-dependent protein